MKRRTQWSKQEHAHGVQGGGRDEPSTLQRKTQRKNTKRRQKRLCCVSGVWVEIGGGELDGAKIRAKGKSRQRQKTKQTVQLRTSKIHKTRRQAGGYLNAVNFAEAQPGPSQDGVELWSFYSGDRGGIPGPSPGPDRTSEKKALLNRPTKVGPWWQSTFFLSTNQYINHWLSLLTTINHY